MPRHHRHQFLRPYTLGLVDGKYPAVVDCYCGKRAPSRVFKPINNSRGVWLAK